MKKLFLGCAAVVGLVVSALAVGHAQTSVAQFTITVEPSASGLKATCLKGCSWKTLSFTCKQGQACIAEIDQNGVGGAGKF